MNRIDVKRIRAKLGMTQVEFAKHVGVSRRAVERWEGECYKSNVGAANAAKLAEIERVFDAKKKKGGK